VLSSFAVLPRRARTALACLVTLLVLGLPSTAFARGGSYAVIGGNAADRAQIHDALAASSFDWSLVPALVEIHVVPGIPAQAAPGEIWLDPALLRAGIFSWAVVQDEYAHQVDFFLLDDAEHALLDDAFGTKYWCHEDHPGLPHAAYGCEKFTSTFVWAYWPSRSNAYKPSTVNSEATMTPWSFRHLMASVIDPNATDNAQRNVLGVP
jgi:hypothetical protein